MFEGHDVSGAVRGLGFRAGDRLDLTLGWQRFLD